MLCRKVVSGSVGSDLPGYQPGDGLVMAWIPRTCSIRTPMSQCHIAALLALFSLGRSYASLHAIEPLRRRNRGGHGTDPTDCLSDGPTVAGLTLI